MPKRNDIEKVLLIGSGPNVIGQGGEYDLLLCQALKALKELGIETVMVNSNPATLSSDVSLADSTYIEPLDVRHLAAIIARENPTAIIPVFGGQKALNLCSELSKSGILENNDVKVIGVTTNSIEISENRLSFKKLMLELGLDMAKSSAASNVEEAEGIAKYLNFPVVIRPAFTTGGFGGGLVYNFEELRDVAGRGIAASMVRNVLIEEAVLNWKELEVEALRDGKGKVIIAGIVENIDPMGVHTGDSVSIIPPQSLSGKVIERIKTSSVSIANALSVTGSINIQFAYNPANDKLIVIEVNLRASRSTALISKVSGLAMGDIATRLIMGMTLDEIKPQGSGLTLEGYDADLDYVAIKVPCWSMDKFKGSIDKLGTQMKSVGEVLAIGSSFKEAFNKAFISLENNRVGLALDNNMNLDEYYSLLRCPSSERYYNIYNALLKGGSIEYIAELTGIDKYYIAQINEIVSLEKEIRERESITSGTRTDDTLLKQAKAMGFSDKYIARIKGVDEGSIRKYRYNNNIIASYGMVPYNGVIYTTYKSRLSYDTTSATRKVVILGSGPVRIGQGAEFDYSIVHCANTVKSLGYEPIIINCNPAAVSTDTSSGIKVYLEPMLSEVILPIISREKPIGVISCFGGHTPYSMINELISEGVNLLGVDKESVALTENKDQFKLMLENLEISMPNSGVVDNNEQAQKIASRIGYPVIVRPSYVMGGRGMEIIHESEGLRRYMLKCQGEKINIEKFLTDATELEVDAICSGNEVVIPEIMEHIEYAGIHSGDSDCLIPASEKLNLRIIKEATAKICKSLKVKGLINIKYALQDNHLYVLEARIRASRSVPLVSRAIGMDISKIATEILLSDKETGERKLREVKPKNINYYSIKAAVFPFDMFREVDPMLGPEMRSTGSVLGLASTVGDAYYKAQAATDVPIPLNGTVMISVDDSRKKTLDAIANEFIKLGFRILATSGTYNYLISKGIKADKIDKMYEGRPNIADAMINKQVDILVNTPSGIKSEYDDSFIRKIAIRQRICYITTIEAANAAISGIKEAKLGKCNVRSLQSYYR